MPRVCIMLTAPVSNRDGDSLRQARDALPTIASPQGNAHSPQRHGTPRQSSIYAWIRRFALIQ